MPAPFFHRVLLSLDRTLAELADAFEFSRGRIRAGSLISAVYPRMKHALYSRLRQGVVLIAGTNGKTTTGLLLERILQEAGYATMHKTIAASVENETTEAFARLAAQGAGKDAHYGIFGVHDAGMGEAVRILAPRVTVATNLYRDGVDGDTDAVVQDWRASCLGLKPEQHLILNADDPVLTGGFARGVPARMVYFGVEDVRLGIVSRAAGGMRCYRCGLPLTYRLVALAHLGDYHCARCGWERPMPTVYAIHVEASAGFSKFRIITPAGPLDVHLKLPGVYNVYNAVAAAAAAVALDVNPAVIRRGLENAIPPPGRNESVAIHERLARLHLVKNPTGMNEALRTACMDDAPGHYLFLIDHEPEAGMDTAWIWDADLEMLAGRIASVIVAGTGSDHLALRFKHAGMKMVEINPDTDEAFQRALGRVSKNGCLWVIATSGALWGIRQGLADIGAI